MRIDSVNAMRLPDSIKMTLQAKLDSDTGFVFWGEELEYTPLAEIANNYGSIFSRYHDNITEYQKNTFQRWYAGIQEQARLQQDSIPPDMKKAFIDGASHAFYSYAKVDYLVKKIYDRHTKTWKEPEGGEYTVTRYRLVYQGPVIETSPLTLLAEIQTATRASEFTRIIFEDGRSRVLEPKEFNSLATIANQELSYIPFRYRLEINNDMSRIYKKNIANAIERGDREAIQKNMALLDSFLVYAEGRLFYSEPEPLACLTKQLMNAYLHTFEDGLDCNSLAGFVDETGRIIHTMLEDSVRAMQKSGELEKLLADQSAGDRAFWRVIGGALTMSDQDDLNEIVMANVDSIKKVEQKNFITNRYYKGWAVGMTSEMAMGGGISSGIGDVRDYNFKKQLSFNVNLAFRRRLQRAHSQFRQVQRRRMAEHVPAGPVRRLPHLHHLVRRKQGVPGPHHPLYRPHDCRGKGPRKVACRCRVPLWHRIRLLLYQVQGKRAIAPGA